jgi:hypothetical protein
LSDWPIHLFSLLTAGLTQLADLAGVTANSKLAQKLSCGRDHVAHLNALDPGGDAR